LVAVNLVAEPLTPDQLRALQILATTYREHNEWPNWKWLRRQLGLGPTADQALRSLPRLGKRYVIHGWVYGYFWTSEAIEGLVGINDSTVIGLTVAGLYRAGAQELVDDYLRTLAAAVATSQAFQPSRTKAERPRFSDVQVSALEPGGGALTGVDVRELLNTSRRSQDKATAGLPTAVGTSS
jgi:hypothetical protein